MLQKNAKNIAILSMAICQLSEILTVGLIYSHVGLCELFNDFKGASLSLSKQRTNFISS